MNSNDANEYKVNIMPTAISEKRKIEFCGQNHL